MSTRWLRGFRDAKISTSGGGAPVDAEFVVLGLDSHLTAERVLTGQSGVVSLTDNGPNSTLIIDVAAHGIDFTRFQQISTDKLLGRSTAGTGNVEQIAVGTGLSLAAGTLSASAAAHTGIATVDFGPPNAVQAAVTITGQAAIASGSVVDAWVRPEATPDHSVDEVIIEPLRLNVSAIVPGVGFTINALCDRGTTYGKFDVNWSWT